MAEKIIFWMRKPAIVVVTGRDRSVAAAAISRALEHGLSGTKIINSGLENDFEFSSAAFFLKHSSLPVFVVTSGDDEKTGPKLVQLAENMPSCGRLVLNFDDAALRQLAKRTKASSSTFGFQEGADFRATDIFVTETETNFKINYEGKIVPFWLTNVFGNEHIYATLAASAVGSSKGLNLVAISQAFINNKEAVLPG